MLYYSGVVQSLLDCGALAPNTTRIAGLSGGAFTAVTTHLGISGREQADLWKSVMLGGAPRVEGSLGSCGSTLMGCASASSAPNGVGYTVLVQEMLDARLTEEDVERGAPGDCTPVWPHAVGTGPCWLVACHCHCQCLWLAIVRKGLAHVWARH